MCPCSMPVSLQTAVGKECIGKTQIGLMHTWNSQDSQNKTSQKPISWSVVRKDGSACRIYFMISYASSDIRDIAYHWSLCRLFGKISNTTGSQRRSSLTKHALITSGTQLHQNPNRNILHAKAVLIEWKCAGIQDKRGYSWKEVLNQNLFAASLGPSQDIKIVWSLMTCSATNTQSRTAVKCYREDESPFMGALMEAC